MEPSVQTLIGMSIFTATALAFLAVDTRGAVIHLRKEPWTNHAMFHAVTGLFYTQTLCILVTVLTWIPFRQVDSWSWWAILSIGVAIHGGHFLGDALTHGGLRGGGTAQGPGLVFFAGTGVALLMYIAGAGLTYQHVY